MKTFLAIYFNKDFEGWLQALHPLSHRSLNKIFYFLHLERFTANEHSSTLTTRMTYNMTNKDQ